VTITVDGKKVAIPESPVMATNANGYMDATNYQVYAPLKDSSNIEVSATEGIEGKVTFLVSPVNSGRATVKATYNGKTKTFLIN
jgi:hypothetical protein